MHWRLRPLALTMGAAGLPGPLTLSAHPIFNRTMLPLSIRQQMVVAGLSGAATLGILALTSAPARAVALCGAAPVAYNVVFGGGFSCQIGNAIISDFDTSFAPRPQTTAAVGFAFFDDIYDVDFNFNPAEVFDPSIVFGYKLTLIDPREVFVGAALDVSGNGVRPRPGTTEPGEYGGVLNVLNAELAEVLELTSVDGVRDPVGVGFSPIPGLRTINIAQVVGTTPQQPSGVFPTINNVSNQFITETRPDSVPGPLGVAGIGGAFFWARRLRRRINAA